MNLELLTIELIHSNDYSRSQIENSLFEELSQKLAKQGDPVFRGSERYPCRAFLIERGAFLRIMADSREIEQWVQVHVFSLSPQVQQLMCSEEEASVAPEVKRFCMNTPAS